jgi:hypothetical protein
LRSRGQQRQKGRIRNSFNFSWLIEQAVPFPLGYRSPQYIVHGPIPPQVEWPGHPGNPKADNHNGQRKEEEKVGLETNPCMKVRR